MEIGVAGRTERNEILLYVTTAMTAKLFVVYLKIRRAAARLASPPVSP